MILDFFKAPSELRQFAPQMPTDGKIDAFEAHYRPQFQKIVNLIGLETYNTLKTTYNTEGFDETTVLGVAVGYLRAALANMIAGPYFIFEASQRNNTSNNLYRYQEDKQLEMYLENSFAELNFLLNHMESNIADFTDYAATDQYKLRQTLFIKNAKEFQRYYGAVNSSYFFNNVVFIIEEVQNDEIAPRLKDFSEITDEKMKFLIGKAIAYETLSKACQQLDYTELPAGIRADVLKDTDTRTAKGMTTESDLKNSAAAYFHNKAAMYFLKIEEAHNTTRNSGTYILTESTLLETDKFYQP
ncbi:MAG: hypothetical protein JZU49_00980 [Sulfuricurvum sp.]|nr:hypothetical protein [Sulfuricurvum sp.]